MSFPACSSVCVAATFLQRCVNEVISQAWLSAAGMWLSLYLLSRLCSKSLCSHHPLSISPPFILHHWCLCCQDPAVDPSTLTLSSMHPPSSLHLPHYHPIILHPPAIPPSSVYLRRHTDTDWLNRQRCSWLASCAAVHRQTEPDNLSGMEKFRQEGNLSKPLQGHLYIMYSSWISSVSSHHLLSISQSPV